MHAVSLQLLTTPRGQHDQQLLVPLIVLMAQHLDWTLYTLHTEHVKEVAELYDKISYTTQQVRRVCVQRLAHRVMHLHNCICITARAAACTCPLWVALTAR
jgi:hypothetical protein